MGATGGTLALVGGGEWSEGCTFDDRLLAAAATDEVVVLTTAAAYESPRRLLDRARAWFGERGVQVVDGGVLTRSDALNEARAAVVADARFVYLSGGSPMHLRSVLKDTPTFDALAGLWRSGGVLAGSGAGADVFCDPMVDTRGGAFTVGLGIVPRVAVIPRVDEWSPDKVHRTVTLAPADVVLVGLPQRTAVIRDPDGTWRADGVGDVVVYQGGAETSLSVLP